MPSPAEGATVAWIPIHVIFEILSRTPLKSVCRFRCVCKGWHALVSDPVFVAAHECRAEPHLLLVANSSNKECGSQGRDLRLMDMHRKVVRVIKEVGIYSAFCPSFDDTICVTFEDGGNTNVIDLATGKVLVNSQNLDDGVGFGWGIESSCTFGFGRAIPSGAYKVVRLKTHTVNGHSRQTCEVLTLADEAGWRPTESQSFDPVHGRFAITVNGILHFLPRLADGLYVPRFDLESEEWKKPIKGPLEEDGDDTRCKITQLNGKLCMIGSQPRVHSNTRVNIWLMTDYDKEVWKLAYTSRRPSRSVCL